VTTSFLAFHSTYSQNWGLTSAAAIYIILQESVKLGVAFA
jgi:hypothetical protein